MKHLHICSNDKFIDPFISFIIENFNEKNHKFLIVGNKAIGTEIKIRKNVEIADTKKKLIVKTTDLNKSDRIYIHGLSNAYFVLLLFLQPWLLKKCHWAIWGGDLYHYREEKHTLKAKIYEMMRRMVIRNIGGLITHIKGDYELARKWYGAKGKYYYSFMYPSNLYKEYDLSAVEKDSNKKYIQIGNSADPSNNHIEVFEKLLPFKDESFEIICPLSYGDKKYANYVIEKGKELFGDKFTMLTEFIPFDEYLKILAKIDIAIFNHQRQQAVGNITTLLGLGKKVYIRDDITTWKLCEEHKLIRFSINNEIQSLFEPFDDNLKMNNINRIKENFSFEKLIKDWENIFRSSD